MFTKDQKRLIVQVAVVLVLIVKTFGVIPVQANTGTEGGYDIGPETVTDSVYQKTNDCQSGSGYMWTNGPSTPDVAAQVQRELNGKGINAIVAARSYGETDSCGTY